MLQLFYANPNRSFYVREITRKIDEQINSVRRELANLLSIGIIVSENMNNRLYYEVDQKFEYYEPLSTIFGKPGKKISKKSASKEEATVSASGSGSTELDNLQAVGNIELAVYTGQFTRDELSGVDILIVGDVNQTKLGKFIVELEAQDNKEIRYTVMPVEEYRYRLQVKDKFIADIIQSKKQVVIDKHELLTQATK